MRFEVGMPIVCKKELHKSVVDPDWDLLPNHPYIIIEIRPDHFSSTQSFRLKDAKMVGYSSSRFEIYTKDLTRLEKAFYGLETE